MCFDHLVAIVCSLYHHHHHHHHHVYLSEEQYNKQCVDNIGQDKSGNEALTTVLANRHGIINNTNAESNNTELYIKSDNTQDKTTENTVAENWKNRHSVRTALKRVYGD